MIRSIPAPMELLIEGRKTQLKVGVHLNINDECTGKITKETEDRIYIESPCFSGWATKDEIARGILSHPDNDYEEGGEDGG